MEQDAVFAAVEEIPWWRREIRRWPEHRRREWLYLTYKLREEKAFPEEDVEYRAFARLKREWDERIKVWMEKLEQKRRKRERARYPNRPDDPPPVPGRSIEAVRIIIRELDAPSAAEAARRAFDADPDREPGTVVLEEPGIVHTDPLGRRTLLWMPPREFAPWAAAYEVGDRSPASFDATLLPTDAPRGPLLTEEEVIRRFDLVPIERADDPTPEATAVNVLVEERRITESRQRDADQPELQEGSETNATERRPGHFGDGDHAAPEVVLDVGGKHYLAERIIDLMPRHLHYVEPFAGGLAVLLARDPDDERFWMPGHKGVSEVANDLSEALTNFWRVLQDPGTFELFRRKVEAIPMSRVEWAEANDNIFAGGDIVHDAVAFFVDCRQSRAGMMKDFTSITRSRTRRRMNGNVSEWLGCVDGLADVHARLRRVLVENMDGIELIGREDTPGTLFYIDGPYVHGTRTTRDGYAFEMTDDQHVKLIDTLTRIEGKAIVSMYRHPIYDVLHERHGWHLAEIDIANHAAGGDTKRRMKECLWTNYDPSSVAR